MKLTITQIGIYSKDKYGNPLISKQGKPYRKLAMKAQEYGDRWLGGFANKDNETWQVGQVVEADIEQNGKYLNIKMPNKNVTRQEFDKLKKDFEALKDFVYGQPVAVPNNTLETPPPTIPQDNAASSEQTEDDLPF